MSVYTFLRYGGLWYLFNNRYKSGQLLILFCWQFACRIRIRIEYPIRAFKYRDM